MQQGQRDKQKIEKEQEGSPCIRDTAIEGKGEMESVRRDGVGQDATKHRQVV